MRKRKNFGKKTFYIFAVILIGGLAFLFCLQVNMLTKESNLLKEQTKRISELSRANEDLEMTFVEKNHLDNIEKIAKDLHFEKTEKIHYIRVLESTVAAK